MEVYNHNGQISLLATLGGEELNKPSNLPQDQNSDIGKMTLLTLRVKKK